MIGDPPATAEVIDISLEHGEMRLYGPVSYNCFTSNTTMSDNYTAGYGLEGTPFIPSPTRNRFTVIGCNTLGIIGGYMHSNPDLYVAGCYSYCQGINSTSDGAPCTGMGCCETTISPNLTDFAGVFVINQSSVWNFNPCFYSMLVEAGWYSFRKQELVGHLGFINERAKRGVPVISDWAIRNGSCPKDGAKAPENYACISSNSYCVSASNGAGYLCNCSEGLSVSAVVVMSFTCLKVDTIHILTEKEIKKATENYKDDRVLGYGGHGMVYRGTLDDGKEVAIKKSKVIDDDCKEEFVDVPMLVYEFIPNGTLFEFLHGNDHRSPIPLDLRMKIATQSAEALAYIHSSTSRTILHGDVKSLNILLDNEHNAKVSDFGASTLKSMDKNDFIMFIQGTLGYLDPETFVSHELTEKSDVYSFGINKLRDMLDSEIIDEGIMVVLEKIAELAMHCLDPRGDERPTMKEVAERLQMLRRLQIQLATKTNPIRADYSYGSPSTHVVPEEARYQGMDADLAR
nr:unnamed protein product [Digitaria exilis]